LNDGRHRLEADLAFLVHIGQYVIARLDIAFQNLQSQRVREQFLDRSLERPRSEGRIIAFPEQSFASGRRDLQRNLSIRQVIAQRLQLDIDDFCDLFLAKTLEDDDVNDTFQELRL